MATVRVPTTTDGLHLVAALGVSAVRIEEVIQLLLASGGLARATNVPLDAACMAVFIIMSIVVITRLVRGRTPRLPWLATADVAVLCLLQLAQFMYAPADSRYSTWDAWAYGVSPATMYLMGIAYSSWASCIVADLALTMSYAVAIGSSAVAQGHTVTVASNAIGLFIGAVIVKLAWGYFSRMALSSDELSRLQKADADRLRHTLHDQAGVLGGALNNATIPELVESIDRAMTLARTGLAPRSAAGTLGRAVRDGVIESGVNAELVTTTADRFTLPADVLVPLTSAVRTLLLNVRRHAEATKVTVRATVSSQDYEVSVSDDGKGFDVATTTYGYGLRHQVVGPLETIGLTVHIVSSSGGGTTVVITGSRKEVG